jgi:hypothetical protein
MDNGRTELEKALAVLYEADRILDKLDRILTESAKVLRS